MRKGNVRSAVPDSRSSLNDGAEESDAQTLQEHRTIEREHHGKDEHQGGDRTRRIGHVAHLALPADEKERRGKQRKIAERVQLGELCRPQQKHRHGKEFTEEAKSKRRRKRRYALAIAH